MSRSSPSPLMGVDAGGVHAVFPESWQAVPLPAARYPQQGFIASPSLSEWEQGVGTVGGMEAFWIDVGKVGIPSDYYYLAARGSLLGRLSEDKECRPGHRTVFVDHPPDLTGMRYSPSDYVASASGTCRSEGDTEPARWTYMVAAPGYGPIRQVGIPTSGLYVVIAVVRGQGSRQLLKEMMDEARFGNTTVAQLLQVAASGKVAS
jgi:hypothetical protein